APSEAASIEPALASAAPSDAAALASSETAGTAGVTATPAGGGAPAVDHSARARAAFDKRDGVTCVREYDENDRDQSNPALKSTNPAGNYALTRSRCMMLAGDCDGGRALWRSARAAHEHVTSEGALDLAVDK